MPICSILQEEGISGVVVLGAPAAGVAAIAEVLPIRRQVVLTIEKTFQKRLLFSVVIASQPLIIML